MEIVEAEDLLLFCATELTGTSITGIENIAAVIMIFSQASCLASLSVPSKH